MDENAIKKLIRKTIIIIVILCLVLFGTGVVTMYYSMQTSHDMEHVQMQEETKEYRSRIHKQTHKNFQILESLAATYESYGMDTAEEIKKSLESVNRHNSFRSVAFLQKNGIGVNSIGKEDGVLEITRDDIHPYALEAMDKAMKGEDAISKMFMSSWNDEKVMVYAVPLYRDGEVVGVLSAADSLEIFEDIAQGETVMNGGGYVHIIADDGTFLVRSSKTVVKEPMESIYDGNIFTDKTIGKIEDILSEEKSGFADFMYRGEKYHIYIAPVGLNNLYIFCVGRLWGASELYGRMMYITAAAFFIISIVAVASMLYGYRRLKKNFAMMENMINIDPVTESFTRYKFDRELDRVAAQKKDYCVVALDVHNFRFINKLFGVKNGDRLLKYIRDTAEKFLEEGEFICRETGDRFYILLLEDDRAEVERRVAEIMKTVEDSIGSAGEEDYGYDISLYCGVAMQGTCGKALIALRSIRQIARENIAFFDNELMNVMQRRAELESNMYSALEKNEFRMYLQPQYYLDGSGIAGAEALVRWVKEDGTFIYPDEFIPLFEENGFIAKLDMYMFRKVCEQIRQWKNAGIEDMHISVNQSRLLFYNNGYADALLEVTQEYGVSPSAITLEIVERAVGGDMEYIQKQLEALHSAGFRVSMDDFGSGYSSLNMLSELEIDELKIDRTFLLRINSGSEEKDKAYITLETVMDLMKKIGINTVAEGIETEEDERLMRDFGCTTGQGYYYSRPVPEEVFSSQYLTEK